ncbi:dihydrolipoamide acetyltransferase family protein [Daejeonella sp.]|uniref:dihydrolipoamide acetyltransferase family protein n=1 Tax=Daejeonella sp. TaxID=2805397 RepID=UPI0027318A33|nr:dihydrolipoamide acetyltransferase family protein [Daejeonella sp.]MDP2413619.1 dihydrolipoamide acetyltransferase family protein [Daejeonella sp.]
MALYELVLPKMGESVAEATIIKWVKQPGDQIDIDESVLEIATDKVDSEVPSPVSGKLLKIFFKEDDIVQVGAVIATIETEAIAKQAENPPSEQVFTPVLPLEVEEYVQRDGIPDLAAANQEESIKPVDFSNSSRFYSPLVKSMAAEEGISTADLDKIIGTGSEGRVTKKDIIDFINSGKTVQTEVASKELPLSVPSPEPVQERKTPSVSVSGGDEIIEMDRMRKLIADHMVMSKQTSAHVTSFVEADVTNLVQWRDRIKNSFEKREGEKITFTPIFIEAVAKAIKDLPMINISVSGTQIIKKRDINIGMAAALPSGNLIVPVIKNADQLNLYGLTKAVNDLASRARLSKLKPDETQGGTFTMTNLGTFGNIMGTPIINQPQVAVLAVGAIKKKPAVIETEFGDVIAIRHMMFLSLSYDHRVVDGSLGGSFVRRVADYLESWDVNREL